MRVIIFSKNDAQFLDNPIDSNFEVSISSSTKIRFSENPLIIDLDSGFSADARHGYLNGNGEALKMFATAEPLTTIVGIEKLARAVINAYPEQAFRIEDHDEEAATLGFIEFNQNRELIFSSNHPSMLTAFARVLKYYYPAHSEPEVHVKHGDHHSPYFWQEIVSAVLAIGASAKQYVGTYRFFRDIARAPNLMATLVGVATSIPAVAFYYRSNSAIAKKWPAVFKKFWLSANCRGFGIY